MSPRQAFEGLRVVEVADEPSGELVGRLLVEQGAQVIKVEPPEGSAGRRIGPFVSDVSDPESSLHFWFYNPGKQSVVIDLGTEGGREDLLRLLDDADVFLHTLPPAESRRLGLTRERLEEGRQRLITVAITPFGQDGPWADYLTSDLVGLAVGGPLNSCGYDDLSIPPIRPGGNQGYHTASSFAFSSLLLALLDRERTGLGQFVDVSMHESLAVTVELANPYWFYNRTLVRRQTCRPAMPMLTAPALLQCADGAYVYLALIIGETKPWENLVAWMDSHGLAMDLKDPDYSNPRYRKDNFGHVYELLETFASVLDSFTFWDEAQARGLPVGRVNAPEDLFDDPHLAARRFFAEVEYEGIGAVRYPGPLYRISGLHWAIPGPAPKLGERLE